MTRPNPSCLEESRAAIRAPCLCELFDVDVRDLLDPRFAHRQAGIVEEDAKIPHGRHDFSM